jgi:glutamine synthetase
LCVKKPKTPLIARQEFIINCDNKIWNKDIKYYCNIESYGSNIVEEFIKECLNLSIGIDDVNSEDMLGKWTYQISNDNILSTVDDLLISRFVLYKICNKENKRVTFDKSYINYNNKLFDLNGKDNLCKLLIDLI